MIQAQTTVPPPAVGNVLLQEDRPRFVKAYSDAAFADRHFEFTFGDMRTFLLEGGAAIRLNASLKMRYVGGIVEVLNWGLSLPFIEMANVDHHIKRHFLKLQGKAERDELSEDEHLAWMHIVDSMDYSRLCADRARPFYSEGIVRKRDVAGQIFIEWQDGDTEWLKANVTVPLEYLRDGDVFSAYIKRNYRNQTVRIENVSFIGERGSTYAEIPQDWPPALKVAEGLGS